MSAISLTRSKTQWLFLSSLGVIVGIIQPIMGDTRNLDGFQGTKWGMSERQVQEIFEGNLSHWKNKNWSGTTITVFGLKHYDIDGCDFSLEFEFDHAGLARVGLQLNDETKIACPGLIVETLVGKYGLPTTERPLVSLPNPSGHMRLWYIGATRIREIDTAPFKMDNLPVRSSLSIYYEPTQTPGAKKL
jgi:hypothetical protein